MPRANGASSNPRCRAAPKAIVRSKLWDAASKVDRASLPSSGTILAGISGGKIGGPEHDRAAPEQIKATIY